MALILVTLRVDGVTDDAVTMVAACSTVTSEVYHYEVQNDSCLLLVWVFNLVKFADGVVALFNMLSLMLTSATALNTAVEVPPLLVVAPAGATADCFL